MGVSENVGHVMTFSILNATTNKVISRHNIRSAGEPTSTNLRIDPLTTSKVVISRLPSSDDLKDNEEAPDDAKEKSPNDSFSLSKHKMHVLNPNDLVGRIFLIPQEDGQRLRAKIVKSIDDYDVKL